MEFPFNGVERHISILCRVVHLGTYLISTDTPKLQLYSFSVSQLLTEESPNSSFHFCCNMSLSISALLMSSHRSIFPPVEPALWEQLIRKPHTHTWWFHCPAQTQHFLPEPLGLTCPYTHSQTHTHAQDLSLPCQPNLLLTLRMDTPSSNENKSLPSVSQFPFPAFILSISSPPAPNQSLQPLLPAFWYCSHLTHATN